MIYIDDSFRPYKTWDFDAQKAYPNLITLNRHFAKTLIFGIESYFDFIEYSEPTEDQKICVIINNLLELNEIGDAPVITISEDLKTDINWFRPCRDVSQTKQHFIKKPYKMVSVFNTDWPGFSYKDLIAAYHMLETLDDRVELHLFSSSPLKRGMETYNNITFHGLQRNQVMFDHISDSCFFLYPVSNKKFPTVLFESLLIGTGAIAARTDSEWTELVEMYSNEEQLFGLIMKKYVFESHVNHLPVKYNIPKEAHLNESILDLMTKISEIKK